MSDRSSNSSSNINSNINSNRSIKIISNSSNNSSSNRNPIAIAIATRAFYMRLHYLWLLVLLARGVAL